MKNDYFDQLEGIKLDTLPCFDPEGARIMLFSAWLSLFDICLLPLGKRSGTKRSL